MLCSVDALKSFISVHVVLYNIYIQPYLVFACLTLILSHISTVDLINEQNHARILISFDYLILSVNFFIHYDPYSRRYPSFVIGKTTFHVVKVSVHRVYMTTHFSIFEFLKALGSSKMSVHTATLCILRHHRENRKSHSLFHKSVHEICDKRQNENYVEVPNVCSHLWN
jgi:NADH:ubiquinone oxidoreductase subunit K